MTIDKVIIARWQYEVYDNAKNIDEFNEYDWADLCLGFMLAACNGDVDKAYEHRMYCVSRGLV